MPTFYQSLEKQDAQATMRRSCSIPYFRGIDAKMRAGYHTTTVRAYFKRLAYRKGIAMLLNATLREMEISVSVGKTKVVYELVLQADKKSFIKRITKKEVGQLVSLKM